MFYVYHGYSSPDNCDASERPTYILTECRTAEDVAKLKAEFDESIHNECSNVIFRVIEGVERKLRPIETVTKWELA